VRALLLAARSKAYFAAHGEPLFSSHMLDLSEEPHEENVSICAEYLKKMAPMNLILEMEIGITGGVEDGVDNSGVSNDKLYSTPEDTWLVHTTLSPISEKFTIAAAFGNVHGVYKPGNVKLQPELLGSFQKYAAEKTGTEKVSVAQHAARAARAAARRRNGGAAPAVRRRCGGVAAA
jgi:fructose-bisphosphate aldolase class II